VSAFERLESEVRSYCRVFDTVFERGEGSCLYDERGRRYIDFFAGAGALNYGHNHPQLKRGLMDYLSGNGVVHSLDMYTGPKRRFLERFEAAILKPRDMNYKLMFPSPTGTNAVEAALKIARKATGRHNVISFTNGYHGMTVGSLAVTGNLSKRGGAGAPLNYAVSMPFDGYLGEGVDTLDVVERYLDDPSSGVEPPAAFILETIQAEGGINVASFPWLRRLAALAKKHGALLIADDIQVGCGRTGPFFSFEQAGVTPDVITLSKSLSGFGLPFAITLLKPEFDLWKPGEHNGTFRGHNLAFITAAEALDLFWADDALSQDVLEKGEIVRRRLERLVSERGLAAEVRGRGMILGVDFANRDMAGAVSAEAFKRGLIMETAGAQDQVLKFLAPLVIERETLDEGLGLLEAAFDAAVESTAGKAAALTD